MKSSAISSAIPGLARQPTDSSVTPPRKSFALAGPSKTLDRVHDAVRSDLADIRLADRVFAPHYAMAVARFATCPVAVRDARDLDAAAVGMLRTGDIFEVLEFSSGQAWGVAPALGVVGYVCTDCLSWDVPGSLDGAVA